MQQFCVQPASSDLSLELHFTDFLWLVHDRKRSEVAPERSERKNEAGVIEVNGADAVCLTCHGHGLPVSLHEV